jgi:hypothetical protein
MTDQKSASYDYEDPGPKDQSDETIQALETLILTRLADPYRQTDRQLFQDITVKLKDDIIKLQDRLSYQEFQYIAPWALELDRSRCHVKCLEKELRKVKRQLKRKDQEQTDVRSDMFLADERLNQVRQTVERWMNCGESEGESESESEGSAVE